MDLQGVVGGKADVQATCEEQRQRVAVVVQEEGVVGQRRHAEPNLRELALGSELVQGVSLILSGRCGWW